MGGAAGGLAAFGVALAALNQKAEGAIQFFEPPGGSFTDGPSMSYASVSFNPVMGNINTSGEDIEIASCSGYLFGSEFSDPCVGDFSYIQFAADPDEAIAFLSAMDTLDGDYPYWTSGSFLPFSGSMGFMPGSFPMDDTPFYIGYRFKLPGMDYGDYHYGYAQLSYFYDDGFQAVTLYNFAYEDIANQGIAVSAIPEPGLVGAIMGLVVCGLVGYKRLRKKWAPARAAEALAGE